jgi:hypothetical protein
MALPGDLRWVWKLLAAPVGGYGYRRCGESTGARYGQMRLLLGPAHRLVRFRAASVAVKWPTFQTLSMRMTPLEML